MWGTLLPSKTVTQKYLKVSQVKISLVGERMFLKGKIKNIPGEKWEISPTPRQGVKETCSGKEQDCKERGSIKKRD